MTQTSDWPSTPSAGASAGGPAQKKATQVAQSAKDSGAEVAQTAAEQAKTVAEQAGRQARDLAQEARSQLREQTGAQQQKAVTGLRALVDELQAMAHDSGQSGPATQVAHQLADRGRQAADWLEQREPGDLLEEFRRVGRRRPGALLAGAALAGVLAGRLTRGAAAASSQDSPPRQDHRPLPQPAPYPPGMGTEPIYGAPASELPSEPGGWR